jgi:hypothetical protein
MVNKKLSITHEWRNVFYHPNKNKEDNISLSFEMFNKDRNRNLENSFERIWKIHLKEFRKYDTCSANNKSKRTYAPQKYE